jgi:anti-anti-sigma regulatory factor
LRDEEKFPTVRFLKCRQCGHVYTASLTGVNSCPKCKTSAAPEENDGKSFRKELKGRHILFAVTGAVYRLQELENLKAEIEASLKGNSDSIAFAFEGSSYLDSSLINLLVKTLQTLSQRGKSTYVITQDLHVLESLQVLNLDKVLTVLPTAAHYHEAIKA